MQSAESSSAGGRRKETTQGGVKKLSFVPSVPQRRAKKEGSASLLAQSSQQTESRGGRGRGQGKDQDAGRGRGRGRGRGADAQSFANSFASGPFSLGPSNAVSRGAFVTSETGSLHTLDSQSHNTDRSVDAYDKRKDDMKFNMGDDEWSPVVLPVENKEDAAVKVKPKHKENNKSKPKIKRERDYLNGKTHEVTMTEQFKNEEGDNSDAIDDIKEAYEEEYEESKVHRSDDAASNLLPMFDIDPAMPTTSLDKIFLLQFPPILPKFDLLSLPTIYKDPTTNETALRARGDLDEEVTVKMEDQNLPNTTKNLRTANEGENTTETNPIVQRAAEGCIGKLLVYQSGKMKLCMGDIYLDVSSLSNTSFFQQVVAIDVEHRQSFVMGTVTGKFACSPNLEMLLSQREMEIANMGR